MDWYGVCVCVWTVEGRKGPPRLHRRSIEAPTDYTRSHANHRPFITESDGTGQSI